MYRNVLKVNDLRLFATKRGSQYDEDDSLSVIEFIACINVGDVSFYIYVVVTPFPKAEYNTEKHIRSNQAVSYPSPEDLCPSKLASDVCLGRRKPSLNEPRRRSESTGAP